MESSSEQTSPTPQPTVHRSFTVPAKLEPQRPATSGSASSVASAAAPVAGDVETLYTHWFAKVVNFSTPASSGRRDSGASSVLSESDDAGTLPWTTSGERTMAAGPLRIYRVPNSVAFLNSGSLLHPILPKSQCWCVDGDSKFVLRIRLNSYYRIEFPFESEEEKAKIKDFKIVLTGVLQYEKTRCPFKRGFVVELPLELPPERPPQAPIMRRKSRYSSERAKRWRFDGVWEREDAERRMPEASGAISEEDDDNCSMVSSSTWDGNGRDDSVPRFSSMARVNIEERRRPFLGGRSVSASPGMSHSNPASSTTSLVSQERSSEARVGAIMRQRSQSSSPSIDSFYSFESSVEMGFSASPSVVESPSVYDEALPDPDQVEPEVLKAPSQKRQEPGLTVSTGMACEVPVKTPTGLLSDGRPSSAPSTPTLISDSEDSFEPSLPEVRTPPDTTIRLRRLTGTSRRRAFSPMPPAVNLFTPTKKQEGRHLATLLVQKTCSLLLGPPAHLVALMIRIAAKIAAGTFGLDSYYLGRRGQRLPGTWESSGEEDDWGEEDDFGISLHNLGSGAERNRRGGQNSCEVD